MSEWTPRFNPWLIAMSVMLATFMEVLDTSVANVAVPYIAGSLSASNDEATWVLTSYLVANAIILPASAWFGRRFGRRNFLLVCIGLFTLSSALCGAALNMNMLVLARILQGAGGGALQPVAQAVLQESFPVAQRGLAMAVYGLGVVVAPIIGPTLGGWITDNFSWRWIFYINLPIGLAALSMVARFVEDPPYLREKPAGRLDALGFTLLSIWIGALQVMLDKGQEVDWFSEAWMRWLGVAFVVGLIAFIVWELRNAAPLVDLRVLRNSNLATGT
ncbi:MAG TPA: DHA2 family efflux MFS transporter permease subunit, partial [Candidatus Xenobia bacterium]